jgi:hypothetical protein
MSTATLTFPIRREPELLGPGAPLIRILCE